MKQKKAHFRNLQPDCCLAHLVEPKTDDQEPPPPSGLGVPPWSRLDGGPPHQDWMGVPPIGTEWGYPLSGLDGVPPLSGLDGVPPPRQEQQSQHLPRSGRYASCVHVGGLSC